MSDYKGRYAWFLVYPESAPKDWKEQLKKSLGSYAISPLHEPDEDAAKPHYHVIYCHGNTATQKAIKEAIPETVPANGHIEMLRQPRTAQRYLLHLDDPDKQQFDTDTPIEVLNGFPVDLTREFSSAEKRAMKIKCFDVIRDYDIFEYCDMLDILQSIDLDLHEYASTHTILFNTYISSRRNKALSEN